MKNSNDTIRNRTRDLPACSAVPQPTAPPRALLQSMYLNININLYVMFNLDKYYLKLAVYYDTKIQPCHLHYGPQ